MKNKHLLNDKFATSKLPEICAPRHELLKTFHRESDKRVIFVSAPAGYGKTVSTLLWLYNSGRKIIWIGLDGYDNAPSIFYKLFCTAILSIQPENKAMADMLKNPAFASSPVEHTIRFLSEFVPDEKLYALVLDDMHLVTNKEIRKSGLLVRKRLPMSFITLILTRNEVAEEYISAIGAEKTALIAARELAFSEEEIRKYFGGYGHFITEDEASAVHAVTDGWAIGVNALAKSGKMELGQNGGHILENYIKTQIWDKWEEDLQDFMLRTAIVEEITTELANKLTGRTDSKDILDRLHAANLFVIRHGGDIYSYHHLFLEFLRNQAKERELSIKEIHKQAAEYYVSRGDYLTGRKHAMKSQDSEMIVQMMHGFFQYTSPSLTEYVNFSKTFNQDALPEYICDQYPFLYSAHIWLNQMCGNAKKMEYYLDKLYHHLPVIAAKFPQFLEASYLLISLDHRTSFSKQVEQFAQLPPITYVSKTPQGASITLQMPFLHRSNRDYYEVRNEELMAKTRVTYGTLLKEKSKLLLACVSAGLLLEQNRLREAAEKAELCGGLIKKDTPPEIMYSAYLHQAAVYHAAGDERRFSEMVNQAESYIESSGAHYLRPNFIAYKTNILLLSGDQSAAKAWLENYFVIESEHLELYRIFQHFTTARAYVVLAQTDKARRHILKLKQLGTDFKRPLDIAEASVLQAVLEWALGNRQEAQDTLEAVLTAMQEHGFVRVISDEGASILPVLKKITSKLKKENYHGSLQARYLNEVTIAAYEQSRRHKGIAIHINAKPVKLSKQQKLILTLLSKGYKYTEIMKATGLTIHTVKSHASAAYAKLDVNNSMDAVLKARELRIIE